MNTNYKGIVPESATHLAAIMGMLFLLSSVRVSLAASTSSLLIPSTTPWTDTGIFVNSGSILRIQAWDMVSYWGSRPYAVTGPGGTNWDGTQFFSDATLPNTTVVSLIGKIGGTSMAGTGTPVPEGLPGNGEGYVGASYNQRVATGGELFLGFNDRPCCFWDNSGSFSVTVVLDSPPVAVARVAPLFALLPGETNLLILSPNNTSAAVVLDGSESSDADNDPLQFSWCVDGQTNGLSTDAVAAAVLPVGPHRAALVVSDGYSTATAEVSFEIIPPSTAVAQLVQLVNDSGLGARDQHGLRATLLAAAAAFDRGSVTAALNQLSAFQNKVCAQIAPSTPALANELISGAQQIITVVSGG
jgi:hypothetical protein